MMEPLPLIPSKKDEVIKDARPLLHAVFRDVVPGPLPLPAPLQPSGACNIPRELASTSWVQNYKLENKKLTDQEDGLKDSFAKKLSRKQILNEYKIRHHKRPKIAGTWRLEKGVVSRRDLKPTIVENAAGDAVLWVRNCLADDSRTWSNTCPCTNALFQEHVTVKPNKVNDSSYKYICASPAMKLRKPISIVKTAQTPEPQYITCIPDEVEFVNFMIGQLHTETIRIVNISRFELRISLKPPKRRELDIEILSSRGLSLTAGASTKIKVRFTPIDVRIIEEELIVRVNKGKSVVIKIKCYKKPPTLEIMLGIPDLVQYTKEDVNSVISMDYLDLGARLLGDVHHVPLAFYSKSNNINFLIMTEEDWDNYILNENVFQGFLFSDGFALKPVYIQGGGWIQGSIWFNALNAGLHYLELKIISSTATIRSISLVADSVMFSPTNIAIQAQDKDFDICSEDDPACLYYVNLGEAFPGRSLTSTVKMINNSAVSYSYNWRSRPWGVCSCYRDHDEDSEFSACTGEKMMSEGFEQQPPMEDEKNAQISPVEGILGPHETIELCITANASTKLGTHRTVFMLILNDIPEECIPSSFKPDTIKTITFEKEQIPGKERWTRTVHSFITCQMEVWWKTVPLCFLMVPPALYLRHSLKVSSVNLELCACQLTGSEEIKTRLCDNGRRLRSEVVLPAARAPHAARISMVQPLRTKPSVDVAILEALSGEWQACTRVMTIPAPRAPHLFPTTALRPLAYAGSMVTFEFTLKNETNASISWRAVAIPWQDIQVNAWCMLAPCPLCSNHTCRCDALRPASGHLMHGEQTEIIYRFSAPKTEGVYANLLSIRYTRTQTCEESPTTAEYDKCIEESRLFPASLVAYRVMNPVVVLRVKPCLGNCKHLDDTKCSRDCVLDSPIHGVPHYGTAVLRPGRVILWRIRTCYRLTITNITPVPTKLRWDDATDSEDYVKVLFIPNEIEIGSYSTVACQVLLEGARVCQRRLTVRTATLLRSPDPVYLIIDAAVAGLEVIVEIPLGGSTSGYATLKLIQREKSSRKEDPKMTFEEIFAANDRKKEINRANICGCKQEWVYIPPKIEQRPPRDPDELGSDPYTSPEIVTEPPLTLVCECLPVTRPAIPEEPEPLCLQFRAVPLHTECKQRIFFRNLSPQKANWTTLVRRWPLIKTVSLHHEERWKRHLSEIGVGVAVTSSGALLPYENTFVEVTVCGDTWGVYHDELLIQIDELTPIIVGIWIEIVGLPLRFVIEQKNKSEEAIPQLCISHQDANRTIKATNDSRSDLFIRTYITSEHENPRDIMPFRVYIRFYDIEAPFCACDGSTSSDSLNYSRSSSGTNLKMSTGIDLYLAPDHGYQNNQYYQVEPVETLVEAGKQVTWKVTKNEIDERELIPNSVLMLRMEPVVSIGSFYARPPLSPRAVRVIATPRDTKLQVSSCRLTVQLNALQLPTNEILRRIFHSIRKFTTVRNVGLGPVCVTANVAWPWRVLTKQPIHMPQGSSMELAVEVETELEMTFNAPVAKDANVSREQMKISCTKLTLTDKHSVLATLPLELRVEYPSLFVEPARIDFHYVKTGDYRKSYFSIWHSSCTERVEVEVSTSEDSLSLHPTELSITPRSRVRVYIMYESRLSPPILDTYIKIVSKPHRNWCTAQLRVEGEPARDQRCYLPVHDHTDDNVLMGQLL